MNRLKKLAPLALLGMLALAGCKGKEYEPDPATIPNIPPSGRAARGLKLGLVRARQIP